MKLMVCYMGNKKVDEFLLEYFVSCVHDPECLRVICKSYPLGKRMIAIECDHIEVEER